jgi:hypothetical protein
LRKAARAKTKFYKYKACGKRYTFSEIKGLQWLCIRNVLGH